MKNVRTSILGILLTLGLVACSASREAPKYKKERNNQIYTIADRQLPNQPTYNPVRWVRPPEMLPSRNAPKNHKNWKLDPVYQFELKNSTLGEATLVLANALGYRSYCAPSISEQPFSLTMLGTISEISSTISKIAGIKVVIDSDTKDVRFLANDSLVPQFAER